MGFEGGLLFLRLLSIVMLLILYYKATHTHTHESAHKSTHTHTHTHTHESAHTHTRERAHTHSNDFPPPPLPQQWGWCQLQLSVPVLLRLKCLCPSPPLAWSAGRTLYPPPPPFTPHAAFRSRGTLLSPLGAGEQLEVITCDGQTHLKPSRLHGEIRKFGVTSPAGEFFHLTGDENNILTKEAHSVCGV